MGSLSSFRSLVVTAVLGAAFTACPPPTPQPGDGGVTPDGGQADSGIVVDAGTLVPAGFSVAAPKPQGPNQGEFGTDIALALDGQGHPLLAWIWNGPGADPSMTAVYFSRWSGATGAWTTPVRVEVIGNGFANPPLRHVALAYDVSTRRIGVAYGRFNQRTPPRNELLYTTHLALSTDDGLSFTNEQVSERQRADSGSEEAYLPSLALANGTTHLAYFQRWQRCTSGSGSECHAVWYVTRTGTSGAFTRTLVPLPAQGNGSRPLPPTLALDSAGAAGLTYLVGTATQTTQVAWWRPGSASASVVLDSAGVQNDGPVVAIAFDGTRPRIATNLHSEASPPADVRLASSDDGVSWTTEGIPRAGAQVTSGYLALVAGQVTAVAGQFNAATGAGTCDGGPKLGRRVGSTWTVCSLDGATVPTFAGRYTNLATTPGGKLVAAFLYTETTNALLGPGIVVWREP